MESAGVLIYGYHGEDARRIRIFLEEVSGAPVFVTGASGQNETRIIDILQNTTESRFADEEPRIMMLLGFSEEQINAILGGFSAGLQGVGRPIFCMMTENNQNWPLKQLLEHLEEERRYWARKTPHENSEGDA